MISSVMGVGLKGRGMGSQVYQVRSYLLGTKLWEWLVNVTSSHDEVIDQLGSSYLKT